ncbi:MAG: M48 family metalloprotease [Blastocatellia bacterium]
MPKTFFIAVISILATPPFSQPGRAQSLPQTGPGRDMNREKAIWRELEKVAPKSVETFKAATETFDKKDYEQAAKLYRQVMEKAPGFDPVYRRLGSALALSGESEEGLRYLERAYEMNPSPENLSTLAQLLDRQGNGMESSQYNKLRALEFAKKAMADYRAQNRGDDPSYAITVAQIAFEVNDIGNARVAARSLAAGHPDMMETHYYLALLAAHDREWEKAEEKIKLAQSLGLQGEIAQRFLDSGVRARARNVRGWRYFNYSLYLAGVWIAGLAALFTLGNLFSKITLRSIKGADLNGGANAKGIPLWRWYKRLLNIAVVYYYISPPLMIFLAAVAAGSFIYGLIESMPIKFTLIVIVVAATLIYKMIHSLFIKIESEDRGRALKPEEAPGLRELAREVAQAVGARPIDEIRVTSTCDLAVYEKGRLREKMQDRAKRVLILGVGVLDGMRQNAFRALLAHEYGHFSAGGDVARRLGGDISNFIDAIWKARYTWNTFLAFLNLETWNLLLKFLRVYENVLDHIARGAKRLQEILADRVAAQNYGAESLEEGLRHVIRREFEFEFKRIKEAAEERAAYYPNPKKGFQLEESPETFDQQMIEKEINDIITRPTTEDDRLPSPIDRFRLAQRVVCNNPPPSNAMVWDLFASRESLTAEMSKPTDDCLRSSSCW